MLTILDSYPGELDQAKQQHLEYQLNELKNQNNPNNPSSLRNGGQRGGIGNSDDHPHDHPHHTSIHGGNSAADMREEMLDKFANRVKHAKDMPSSVRDL